MMNAEIASEIIRSRTHTPSPVRIRAVPGNRGFEGSAGIMTVVTGAGLSGIAFLLYTESYANGGGLYFLGLYNLVSAYGFSRLQYANLT